MDWKRQTSIRGFVVWWAGIEGEVEEINPRDVEKMIMESRQKERQKRLLEETKQIPAGQ